MCLFCFTAGAAQSANLIKNGSFEKPIVPSGSFQLFAQGTSFSGWSVVGAPGNVAIVSGTFMQNGFSFPAKKGAQWLDLTGNSNTRTGVSQTVATTPAQQYTLKFFVGNVSNSGGIFGTTSTVKVLINGTHVLSATNKKGTTTQDWLGFSVTFTASTSATTITFLNGDSSSDTDNGLDAISLVATTASAEDEDYPD